MLPKLTGSHLAFLHVASGTAVGAVTVMGRAVTGDRGGGDGNIQETVPTVFFTRRIHKSDPFYV